MSVILTDKFVSDYITPEQYAEIAPKVQKAHELLRSGTGAGNAFLGWMNLPDNYDKAEFARIQACAEKIQKKCDVLVVIGIGGSYLGARAVIEFLKSPLYNQLKKNTPEIYFAGNCISAVSLQETLALCEGKEVCVNVISKSGTTTEPAIAFRVFRDYMEKRYGAEEAKERIFVTTDREKGTLKAFSTEKGYETFVVPDDIGGRYSVLTAVGLLPIAVAGINIEELMAGAREASHTYTDPDINNNDCYRYAAIRNILYAQGKNVEVLASYEPFTVMLAEWWKQLFGESEGKDGRGIFPASVAFTADLHSMGQYIQDGTRMLFETVLTINDVGTAYDVPNDPANVDGLNFLSGMDLSRIKKTAMKATILAHIDGGVPNIRISLSERSAFALGELLYFFELACAISGYILGVNPFDQPGVESYKKNMFALLGKPGYEDMKKNLEKRLKI